MTTDESHSVGRQERFYLLVGAGGAVLVLASWLLRREEVSGIGIVPYLLAAVVVVVWAASGAAAARRVASEREAAERRAKLEREAQEAAQRATQQVNARRTVSHGGMTINVRRTRPAGGHDVVDLSGAGMGRADASQSDSAAAGRRALRAG